MRRPPSALWRPDRGQELLTGEGLEEYLAARLCRSQEVARLLPARDEDHPHRRVSGLQGVRVADPVEAPAEQQVQQGDVGRVGEIEQERISVRGTGCRQRVEPFDGEKGIQEPSHGWLVVDDQDAYHATGEACAE